jgi:hypothetical protein
VVACSLGPTCGRPSERFAPPLVPFAYILRPKVFFRCNLGVCALTVRVAPLGQEESRVERVVHPLEAYALCCISVDFAAHEGLAGDVDFRLCCSPVWLRRLRKAGLDGMGEARLGLAKRRV